MSRISEILEGMKGGENTILKKTIDLYIALLLGIRERQIFCFFRRYLLFFSEVGLNSTGGFHHHPFSTLLEDENKI